jgi:hypothetical protein
MMEMLALFVGYFLYESNADDWWWTGYWAIVGLKVVQMLFRYDEARRKKSLAEIEKQIKYWEGK